MPGIFTLVWPHLLKSLSLSWSLYSSPGPCPGPWEWSPCPGPCPWHPSPGPGPWWKVLVNITGCECTELTSFVEKWRPRSVARSEGRRRALMTHHTATNVVIHVCPGFRRTSTAWSISVQGTSDIIIIISRSSSSRVTSLSTTSTSWCFLSVRLYMSLSLSDYVSVSVSRRMSVAMFYLLHVTVEFAHFFDECCTQLIIYQKRFLLVIT